MPAIWLPYRCIVGTRRSVRTFWNRGSPATRCPSPVGVPLQEDPPAVGGDPADREERRPRIPVVASLRLARHRATAELRVLVVAERTVALARDEHRSGSAATGRRAHD